MIDKKKYMEECRQRWYGHALQDALSNWKTWQEMDEYLMEAMKQFQRNPFQKDIAGTYHNHNGTLSGFLYHCQEAIQPDKYRIDPFLDFEEHYQKVFMRRGLLIYCGAILDELEKESEKELPLFNQEGIMA
jgi:hypothetical protein